MTTDFSNLPRLQQVAHLAAYGISPLCITHLLGIRLSAVRRHFAALGMVATSKTGGKCLGMGRSQIIRHLTSLGVADPVIRYCADCRQRYVVGVRARPARIAA